MCELLKTSFTLRQQRHNTYLTAIFQDNPNDSILDFLLLWLMEVVWQLEL